MILPRIGRRTERRWPALDGVTDRLVLACPQGLDQPVYLCVPKTSSTSCGQAVFVDQAADASLSSDAVLSEIDRLG